MKYILKTGVFLRIGLIGILIHLSVEFARGNPSGASVVHGNISMQGLGTGGLTINQSSQAAIIDWQNFSIGAGEFTHFNQVAGGIALNRVVSGNPSAIYGTLSATGSLIVVNPNGILVGAGGVIDVNGALTLSTLDIDNADFLNGGDNRFYGSSLNGVVNYGNIRSATGDIAFLGGFAHNFNSVESVSGTVALASGSDIVVGKSGDSIISIRGGSSYTGIGVNQQGNISGVATELQAHGNAYALAINNGGITRATGGVRSNGRSILKAMGSSNTIINSGTVEARNVIGSGGEISITGGRVENTGTVDASGIGANQGGTVTVNAESLYFSDDSRILANSISEGGSVNLKAASVAQVGGHIDVSSMVTAAGDVTVTADDVQISAEILATGGQGGVIKLGGDFQGISSNGIAASSSTVIDGGASFDVSATAGNAGQIIVWSDGDTIFEGEARANATGAVGNGGLIEVSGKENLTFRGLVTAYSKSGSAGTVLFDPGTLTVGNGYNGVNQISNETINTLLQGGTSVLLATQGEDSDIIFVDTGLDNDLNDAIQWTNSDASFGAFAGGNIIVGTHIRTSGEGSINLIGGWTGTEADAYGMFNGTIALPDGSSAPLSLSNGTGAMGIQDIFNYYISTGQFGNPDGNVIVGSSSMTRHVEVGSRYGDTNVAGDNILLIAADTNGESRYAQIGFHDSGQVFAPRMGTLDLNDRALEADNDPLVGIVGNEFGQQTDDGMGVYAINSEGVHDGDGTLSSGADATFIPYANHYMNARNGNWWWQQIHYNSSDPTSAAYVANYDANDLGGNLPEMGAGQSISNTADINVIAASNVLVQGGGSSQSGAYIGHGGDSAGWADNRALLNTGIENGQTQRMWSQNGASNDRSAMSIARLAPVYGNINVLAGVDVDEAISIGYSGEVTATISEGSGSVIVSGLQRLGSAASPTNDESNASGGAPALIGHGGVGQFGEFYGDIQVRAGTSVQVLAGSNTRGYAQIGHNVDTYQYWDSPSNAYAQIRFFSSTNDFNDPLLRRGELFSGSTNIAQALSAGVTTSGEVILGDTYTGVRTDSNFLSDPITGAFTVEALDGSVVTGFHGDIVVEAKSGDVILKGYSTEDQSETGSGNPGDTGLLTSRDSRYAKIGHGGTSAEVGNEASGYSLNRTDRANELVQYRIPTDNSETGAGSVIGEIGQAQNRGLTFMTITGDIEVTAGRNVSVIAGNDVDDFAQIGHGGTELADYETSSFIAGDISINAGGYLEITAGGEVKWTGSASNRHMRGFAQVGHGGHQTGFLGYFGDISINTGGDITITAGAYGDNYAKIGHKGSDDWGQVAGEYDRDENFFFDGVSIDIDSTVTGTTATVLYSGTGTDNLSGTTSKTFELSSNTANITIESGGSVSLLHLDAQERLNANQTDDINQNQMEDAYAQIGHGGNNWGGEYWRNDATNFDDIVGNISVTTAGDLLMEGGNREGMWSRVGHGFTGTNVRVAHGETLMIAGEISVNAAQDVIMDGSAADEMDVNEDQPAKDNGLAIGHGAFVMDEGSSRGQIAVLDGGEVNGISVPSTITVTAGRDILIQGGNGAQDVAGEIGASGTQSQIGHGASSFGDALSTLGFHGDIYVTAGRDLLLRSTDNGIIHDEAGFLVYSSSGGAAIIGNGGIHMDAPASGDIVVYVGNNLGMIAPQRIEEDVNLIGTRSDAGFTHLNFTKIGHFSTENQDTGAVSTGLLEGDITVVVGNDLTMTGGRSTDHNSVNFEDIGLDGETGLYGRQGVTAAFSQIGHGGPGINANLLGDIEVLVQNNFTTNDGTVDASGQVSPLSGNNYVKIGHGDWMRDGTVGFQGAATGLASGDIIVAIGGSADLEHTLIGHGDPAVSALLPGGGTTSFAVSRNYPFYGGEGYLLATGITDQTDAIGAELLGTGMVSGTVFTSGSLGGDPLSIYIPQRDSNLMEAGTTRLNSASVFYHGNNGGGTPGGSGTLSGEVDEVFLSPDLWWMDEEERLAATSLGYGTTGGFPTSASGENQGGVITEVSGVGGLPNLVSLTNGALGSSTNGSLYQSSHGLSGGQYTLFYDAIVPVAVGFPPPPPVPPVPPAPAPDLSPFAFADIFDAFQRSKDGFDGIFGGDGIAGELAYFDQSLIGSDAPAWFLEEFLDIILGPVKSGESSANNPDLELAAVDAEGPVSVASSDVRSEDDEELRRKAARRNRPVGNMGMIYYLSNPGGNSYSSYRLFERPNSNN
ncbi:MAG: filamentous hemagglutinin N-terminal domain-containing protein [Verrucomicrobiales bacterium]|nr:filamentous hemagglutinin N-terminal domain-containing protein [Verrucomicrobiales bacterium]